MQLKKPNLGGNSSQFPSVHELIHLLQHSYGVANRQEALETPAQ